MPEIHQLLLSGSVGSVWNDSSQFILLYPLEKGMQHAAVLVSPYSSPFLFTLSTDLSLVLDFDARLMNILWEWSIPRLQMASTVYLCHCLKSVKRKVQLQTVAWKRLCNQNKRQGWSSMKSGCRILQKMSHFWKIAKSNKCDGQREPGWLSFPTISFPLF